MKILITGSDGYIGRVLCERLLADGHDISGIDAGFYGRCAIEPASRPWPVRRMDVRDVTVGDVRGFDAICHLAALSNDPLGELDERLTAEINCAGSVTLARSARDAGVRRFVFASSCSIYGKRGDQALDEGAQLAPRTAYARSKVETERALSGLASDDFSPTYLRNATAFGWSPAFRSDLVVNDLVLTALATGEVRLRSDGSAWRPLVHVRDIADAFSAALAADRLTVHDQAFNIGVDDQNHRIREVARIVEAALPGTRVTVAAGAQADDRSYRVSFAKARTLAAFRPGWPLRRGIDDLAVRLRGILPSPDPGDVRFIRLAWLRQLREAGELDTALRWA